MKNVGSVLSLIYVFASEPLLKGDETSLDLRQSLSLVSFKA